MSLRGSVPDLFLRLELGVLDDDEIEVALTVLQGRERITVSTRSLPVPLLEGRYVCADGTVWWISGMGCDGKPVDLVGASMYSAHSDVRDGHGESVYSRYGLATMPFYTLTPAGWEAAEPSGGSSSQAPRSPREDDKLPETGANPRPPPVWERLKVQEQFSGDDIASLDGAEYRLAGKAGAFLKALQQTRGGMILASTLRATVGDRADHVYRALPDDLKAIISKPGKGRRGYRMRADRAEHS